MVTGSRTLSPISSRAFVSPTAVTALRHSLQARSSGQLPSKSVLARTYGGSQAVGEAGGELDHPLLSRYISTSTISGSKSRRTSSVRSYSTNYWSSSSHGFSTTASILHTQIRRPNMVLIRDIPKDTSVFYATDPEWEIYAAKHGMSIREDVPADQVEPMDAAMVAQWRSQQVREEEDWAQQHPSSTLGYSTRLEKIKVRDGSEIDIKIYMPTEYSSTDAPLPLLFDLHAGGWIMGSFTTSERRIIHPIISNSQKKLIIISVDYRLVPEITYPAFLDDAWDAFSSIISQPERYNFDPSRVVLAGTSAGGHLTAINALRAREAGTKVKGVLLNVPVLCDYRHWPVQKYGPNKAYSQCLGTELSAGEMRGLWDYVVPLEEGVKVSPLLASAESLRGLPPHVFFVAGQDPVRDEGIMYCKRLKEEGGVDAKLHVYPGVPHNFGEGWETSVTKGYQRDLAAAWETLVDG